MQQMHQGQIPASTTFSNGQHLDQALTELPSQSAPVSANASSLDDLITGAANDASKGEVVVTERKEDKKASKKDKDKNTKLVYSDNEVSPEEKMAQLPRYAFVPSAS